MTKTFRRALACLLAVLMVAFSMPFTALAAEANREWWTVDGIDVSTITAEPDYWGYNTDPQPSGELPWDFDFGKPFELGDPDDEDAEYYEDHRDDYKPIIAVIVSSQGDASIDKNTASKYFNTYYGSSTSANYAKVSADGNILNPADLKAGQRIAVTVEVGGFDALCNGQLMGRFDNEYITPAYYTGTPFSGRNGKDTWTKPAASSATNAVIASGVSGCTDSDAIKYMGAQLYTTAGKWAGSFVGAAFANGQITKSNFIGTANYTNARTFGKYGFTAFTYSFEVLQDCDLSKVFTFIGNADGCIVEPYSRDSIARIEGRPDSDKNNGQYLITLNDTELTFAKFAPIVWDSYEAGSTPEVPHAHDYQLTSTTPATCTEDAVEHYTCTNADGKCDALTSDKTIEKTALGHNFTGKVTANAADKKHNVQCTRCDETTLVACEYTADSAGATCTQGGKIVYTCACGDSYTEANGAALGHDFVNGTVISNTVTKEATCEEDGVRTIVTQCSRCDETDTKTEAIAKLGHDLTTDTVTTPATCEKDGSVVTTTTCSRCDYEDVKTEVLGKLGHDLTTDVETTPATCTEDGKTVTTVTCSRCDYEDVQTEVLGKLGHDLSTETKTTPATYDADGFVTTTTSCSRCDYHEDDVQIIPMLIGVQVTVTASGLGTTTVKGIAVEDEDVTANCEPNSDVVLTATAGDGAKFAGWTVDGKVVSRDATITVKALADVTYVPVFQEIGSTFTVIFSDRYGNVFATQEVTSGAEIDLDAVKAPTVAGYTFVGWTVTAEEAANITEATIIRAVYEKDETAAFTVTADGCTITAGDVTATDKLEDVAYDTLVTVTCDGAKAWKINGATVAYGDSYTFYVGSDVTVVPVKDAVTATPTVAAVSVTKVTDGAKVKASFLATRSMTDDCKFVSAGFVYGKNLDNDYITLDDVKAGSAVKAYYCSTSSEQFALTYSLAAQQGKMTARAFLAYEKDGKTVVIYAEPQTADYADLLK